MIGGIHGAAAAGHGQIAAALDALAGSVRCGICLCIGYCCGCSFLCFCRLCCGLRSGCHRIVRCHVIFRGGRLGAVRFFRGIACGSGAVFRRIAAIRPRRRIAGRGFTAGHFRRSTAGEVCRSTAVTAGCHSAAELLLGGIGYRTCGGNVHLPTALQQVTIGLYAVRAGVDPHDADAVAALLPQVKLGIRLIDGAQHIYLNGEDVSTAIRAENIGMAASAVAAHPAVRSFLLDTQRGLAESQNILMDGRDIGTVVLPNATVKIFLTASAEARAERRARELAEKGQPADLATVLADIRQRDYQDSHRAVAPLKQAEDAILVDTSDIGLQESFDLLKRTILAHV